MCFFARLGIVVFFLRVSVSLRYHEYFGLSAPLGAKILADATAANGWVAKGRDSLWQFPAKRLNESIPALFSQPSIYKQVASAGVRFGPSRRLARARTLLGIFVTASNGLIPEADLQDEESRFAGKRIY
jgi:hypothetical protein